jgi:hypothetical protein
VILRRFLVIQSTNNLNFQKLIDKLVNSLSSFYTRCWIIPNIVWKKERHTCGVGVGRGVNGGQVQTCLTLEG